MQLCECCSQFDTCALDKHTHNKVMDPCSFFDLLDGYSLQRYGALKAQVMRIRASERAIAKRPVIVDTDIPLEVTAREFPVEGFLAFLNADLKKEKKRNAFISKYIEPYFYTDFINSFSNIRELLLKGQDALKQFADGNGDLQEMNRYLAMANPEVHFDDDGLKSRTRIDGSFYDARLTLVPFFVQFAEFVLRKQDLCRCPECAEYYIPARRGPRGATCGKEKCKKARSRKKNPEPRANPAPKVSC